MNRKSCRTTTLQSLAQNPQSQNPHHFYIGYEKITPLHFHDLIFSLLLDFLVYTIRLAVNKSAFSVV
ncbi:hypothetical protein LBW46_16385, partial [Ralstonia solanacearum]